MGKREKDTDPSLPAAANELFGRKACSKSNIQLPVGGGGFDSRTVGFKLAADMIVQQLRMKHVLVFPVCYLYRHYLELSIKQLTWLAKAVLSEEGSYSPGHKLPDLWKECKPILERAMGRRAKEFDAVGKCLDAFASFDFAGEYFRYPEDKNGRSWEQSIKGLNLERMRDSVSNVADILDAFYSQMDNILECRALATP